MTCTQSFFPFLGVATRQSMFDGTNTRNSNEKILCLTLNTVVNKLLTATFSRGKAEQNEKTMQRCCFSDVTGTLNACYFKLISTLSSHFNSRFTKLSLATFWKNCSLARILLLPPFWHGLCSSCLAVDDKIEISLNAIMFLRKKGDSSIFTSIRFFCDLALEFPPRMSVSKIQEMHMIAMSACIITI